MTKVNTGNTEAEVRDQTLNRFSYIKRSRQKLVLKNNASITDIVLKYLVHTLHWQLQEHLWVQMQKKKPQQTNLSESAVKT